MITDMSNRWTDGTDNFPLTILSRTRSWKRGWTLYLGV